MIQILYEWFSKLIEIMLTIFGGILALCGIVVAAILMLVILISLGRLIISTTKGLAESLRPRKKTRSKKVP